MLVSVRMQSYRGVQGMDPSILAEIFKKLRLALK